jgi:hypothetical protein
MRTPVNSPAGPTSATFEQRETEPGAPDRIGLPTRWTRPPLTRARSLRAQGEDALRFGFASPFGRGETQDDRADADRQRIFAHEMAKPPAPAGSRRQHLARSRADVCHSIPHLFDSSFEAVYPPSKVSHESLFLILKPSPVLNSYESREARRKRPVENPSKNPVTVKVSGTRLASDSTSASKRSVSDTLR